MHHTTCNTQGSTCRSMQQALLQERVWLLDHGLHGTADHPKLVCIKSRPDAHCLPTCGHCHCHPHRTALPPGPTRSDPAHFFRRGMISYGKWDSALGVD